MNNKEKPLYARNIRLLRSRAGLTIETASMLAGITREMWASYEEGRAAPRLINLPSVLSVLKFMDVDALVNKDLAASPKEAKPTPADIVKIKAALLELNNYFKIKN